MPKFNVQAALQAGHTQEEINNYLTQRKAAGVDVQPVIKTAQSPINMSGTNPVKTPTKKNGLLDLLSVATSIGGGVLGAPLGAAGVIGGSAIGGGLGQLLEQLIAGQPVDVKDIGKESLYSGAGGALGLGVGKLLARPAAGIATAGARGALGKGTKLGVNEIDQLLARNSGKFTGSAANKARQAYQGIEELGGARSGILASSGGPIPKAQFKATLESAIKNGDNIIYDPTDKKLAANITRYLERIDKLPGDTVGPEDIQNFRVSFNPLTKGAWSKFKAGDISTLNNTQKAAVAMQQGIDDSLPSFVTPEAGAAVKALNRQMADNYTFKGAYDEAARKGTSIPLPFLGRVNIGPLSGAAQSIGDVGARGAAGVMASPVVQQGIGQAGARAVLPGQEATQEPQATPDLLSAGNLPSTQADTGNKVNQLDLVFKAMAIKDIGETGGKNLDKIITLAKFINPSMGKNDTQQQSDTFFTLADNAINSIYSGESTKDPTTGESIGKTDRFGYGPLQGKLYEAALAVGGGAGAPEGAVALNQKYTVLRLNILRAFNGARISDADYQLASKYIPNISDTDTTAKIKLGQLKAFLETAKEQAESKGSDTTGINALLGE